MFKVVSGYDSKDWEFVGVNEGQKSYIRKEPDADDLIERVRLIMRNYSETIDFDTHYELEDKLVNTIQRWSEGNLK
jgi:DNA-binding response OmpR family regulator